MTVFYTIITLTVLFWIFPAIRQYKTELFWYFFVLAISDPIAIALGLLFSMGADLAHLILCFPLLLSLYWLHHKNVYVKAMLSIFLLLILIVFGSSKDLHYTVIALVHIPILFYFLRRTVYFISQNSKLNLFHIFLLLYDLSIILKVVLIVTDINTGVTFFYVTTLFEILIALFFSIYKEDDKRLLINLKNV